MIPLVSKCGQWRILESVFYYNMHSLDLNSQVQDNLPFILGSQMEWQLEMMTKFRLTITLSIDTTFGTVQT